MQSLGLTLLVVFLVAGSAGAGSYFYKRLSDSHRSQATMDFVRLVAGLLTTFTALILGLLLNEVNSTFSMVESDLRAYGSAFIALDTDMEPLGPQAAAPRALLETYLRSMIIETWPAELRPSGTYVAAEIESGHSEVDAANLGKLLVSARAGLRRLAISDDEQRDAQSVCVSRISDILDRRRRLIGEAHATVSAPMLIMMVLWLMVVFASFGITAPRHRFSAIWIGIVALSVGGAVFTILELDGPLDGLIRASSEPMRQALLYLEGAERR